MASPKVFRTSGTISSVRPGGPLARRSLVVNMSPPTLIFSACARYSSTSRVMSRIDSATGRSRYSVA